MTKYVYESSNDKIVANKHFFSIPNHLFSFLILITVIQQFPIIRDSSYLQIRYFLYLSFAILSVLSLKNYKYFLNHSIIKKFIVSIVYTFFIIIPFSLFSSITLPIDFLVSFGILLISSNFHYSRKEVINLVASYSILVTLVGLLSLFYYGQGFNITQTYMIPSKNQIGPMIGIVIIICLSSRDVFEQQKSSYRIFIAYFLAIVNFTVLLAIRNRAGIVAVLVSLFITYISRKRAKLTLKKILIAVIIVSLLLLFSIFGLTNQVIQYTWNSLTLNFDVSNLDSLSGGRIDYLYTAFDFIGRNPLFGELNNVSKMGVDPHNYIIYNLVKYGIFGSFMMIVFYISLWKISIVKILSKRNDNKLIGSILLFALFISFFEFSYPFGPGVSLIIMWFLIGQRISDY